MQKRLAIITGSNFQNFSKITNALAMCAARCCFIGFEFVKDRLIMEPDTELAQKVKNKLRENFILVSTDGPFDNVIKSKPPLCFSKENVQEVIEQLNEILNIEKM